MITLTVGQLISSHLMLSMIVLLLYNRIKNRHKKKSKITYCDYTVRSVTTDHKYHCYAIRQNESITECRIWNYYSRRYEWYPTCHFIFCEEV